MKIPFNKPYLTGKEQNYIAKAVTTAIYSSNDTFEHKCIDFLSNRYGYSNIKLTPTTENAIKLAAKATGIKEGDEVLIPSFCNGIFAEAFSLLGASIKFVDSSADSPNVSYESISPVVSDKTKVIVVSHYGGNACSMAAIIRLAKEHNIIVIEDATDALDARHRGENIGKVGQLSVFSFHESKNITAIDMGMVVINDGKLLADDQEQENEYAKVTETAAAFLLAQLEDIEPVQRNRLNEWINYYNDLESIAKRKGVELPRLSFEDRPNGQNFYIVCKNIHQRNELLAFLRGADIDAFPHHKPLHTLKKYGVYEEESLPNALRYGSCLVRLPMYNTLNDKQRKLVTKAVKSFLRIDEKKPRN